MTLEDKRGTYLSRDENRQGQTSDRKTASVFTAQPEKKGQAERGEPSGAERKGEKTTVRQRRSS